MEFLFWAKTVDGLRQIIERRAAFWAALVSVLLLLLIPARALQYGFTPPDDALRHAATTVSGVMWTDVLLLREGLEVVDTTPGWHLYLRLVHRLTGGDALTLVGVSILSLFACAVLLPLFFMRRVEAWVLALCMVLWLDGGFVFRLLLGRPYLLTFLATLWLFHMALRMSESRHPTGSSENSTRELRALFGAALVALPVTWMHSTWFLLFLAPGACALVGQWRKGFVLGAGIGAGVLLGALLTGDPLTYLFYTIEHALLASEVPSFLRVSELQPMGGNVLLLILFGALLMLPRWVPEASFRPGPELLAGLILTWALGYLVGRFWIDLGMALLLLLTARRIEDWLQAAIPLHSWRRPALAAGFGIVLVLSQTHNRGERWSHTNLDKVVPFKKDLATAVEWLPAPGGILYSDNMGVFYNFFLTWPEAPWKYVLGPEQAIMPQADLAVLHAFGKNKNWDALEPWLQKMKPSDRLVLDIPKGREFPAWQGFEHQTFHNSYTIFRRAPEPPKPPEPPTPPREP